MLVKYSQLVETVIRPTEQVSILHNTSTAIYRHGGGIQVGWPVYTCTPLAKSLLVALHTPAIGKLFKVVCFVASPPPNIFAKSQVALNL